MAKEFPDVDFSVVDPVYPDKTSPAGARFAYKKAAIIARAKDCIADLHQRKEKFVIVFSHSGFLRLGVTGHWFINADYRVFEFEDQPGPDREYVLKQDESTQAGGLGRCWTEKVEIGLGLPEDLKILN
jgi:broad specificity phosphatase PhoE